MRYALVPYGCWNKLLQMCLLKTTYTYFLMVLEDRGPKPVSLGWNQELTGPSILLLGALRENLLPCQHSLTFGHINPTPTSSSHSLWSKNSLCLSLLRTPVVTFGPIQDPRNPGESPHLKTLTLIPLAKSLLPFDVTFKGFWGLECGHLGQRYYSVYYTVDTIIFLRRRKWSLGK